MMTIPDEVDIIVCGGRTPSTKIHMYRELIMSLQGALLVALLLVDWLLSIGTSRSSSSRGVRITSTTLGFIGESPVTSLLYFKTQSNHQTWDLPPKHEARLKDGVILPLSTFKVAC